VFVHQSLNRYNPNELSGYLFEGIKAAVGLTCVEAMSCDERLGEHHYCHMMVEPTPGASLELVNTQYLLDITVVLLDRPPKVCPLDEFVERRLVESPTQPGCQFPVPIVGARVVVAL